jgi:large subunit ribosomal protein L23
MNLFVLKTPHITEKTYRLINTRNAYTFIVDRNATKGQVKEAVETTFGVKVLSVQTTTVAGKGKRTGKKRMVYVQPDKKKAIVRLPEGQKISLFDIETGKQQTKEEVK